MKLLKVSPMNNGNSFPVSVETSSTAATAQQSMADKIKFACDLCGAPFYHRFGLSTHMRRLHGDEEVTTQTFVVLKKPEKNIIKTKRNNKIITINKKSPKINYKNDTKKSQGTHNISGLNGNKDDVVSLDTSDEDEQGEENVPLKNLYKNEKDNVSPQICDEDEPHASEMSDEEMLCLSPEVILGDTSGYNEENYLAPNANMIASSGEYFETNENNQNKEQQEFSDTNTEMPNIIPSALCEIGLHDDTPSEMLDMNTAMTEYSIVDEDGNTFFECPECSKRYRHKRSLNRHLQEVHLPETIRKEEKYTCNTCYGPFKTRKNMSTHLMRTHTKNKKLCKLCNETFGGPRILSKHMLDEHCTVSLHDLMSPMPTVYSPELDYPEQEEQTPPEDFKQVFIPIECDILPVEFETSKDEPVALLTPKEEPVEVTNPNEEPVELITPKEEPVEVTTPNEEPVELITPKEEPVEHITPKEEPVESETPNDEMMET